MNAYASTMLVTGLLLLGIAGEVGLDGPTEPVLSHAVTATAEADPETTNQVVAEYCVRCHSETRRRGDLVLEGFDAATVAESSENAIVAERMIRKLRAGMMPPSGVRRPEAGVLDAVVFDLEETLDEAWHDNPEPGTRTFQRLNRAEYAAAVRDLLGLEVDVAAYLPLDTKSANFDNIADVQMPSTTVMEGYLRARGADRAARDR